MLKILTSVTEYLDFVNEMNRDPNFSDPMLSSQEEIQCNLLDAPPMLHYRVCTGRNERDPEHSG